MVLSQSIKKFFGVDPPESKVETPSVAPTELAHINEEMYKQSAELAERNKALSLLGDINEVFLGSFNNQDEIAQKVTALLVKEADIQIAALFTFDKEQNCLRKLGISEAKNDNSDSQETSNYLSKISLTQSKNTIIQTIKEKKINIFHTLDNTLLSETDIYKVKEIQEKRGIQSIFVFPLVARNQVLGAMVICLTHTEQDLLRYQKNLLDRLGEIIGIAMDNALLYNQVQDANKRLIALDKLKNEFVSVSAHELRTPMSAIKSYLWMALDEKTGTLSEKKRYYVQRGYNSVDRLVRLVNDMLNISRIESGRITIEFQATDLINLTQEVVDEVLPRAKEVGVTISIQKPASLSPVLADPDKIKEVLFNLIGNSLKFTPKGGSITVSYSQKNGMVETKVADTGAGIMAEDMPKLFQRFGLLEGSYITNQTSTSNGTGLGLFICRSIIDLHHGEIKAASEGRGKGTTFTFTLKEFDESDLKEFKTEIPGEGKEKVNLIHAEL